LTQTDNRELQSRRHTAPKDWWRPPLQRFLRV
jgi:hypothetical protein